MRSVSGEMKIVYRYGRSLLYEDGTSDLSCIGEQPRSYSYLFDFPGWEESDKSVLDLGGNRGYFAAYALSRGARRVVSVEPEETNQDIFRSNVPEVLLLNGAVLRRPTPSVDLFLSSGTNTGSHTVVSRKTRESVRVPGLGFWDLLEVYRPAVVKIDIEDSEYLLGLDEEPLPPYVKALAIEYGIRDNLSRNARASILAGDLYSPLASCVFLRTYLGIQCQFPVVGVDTTKRLTKLNWGAIYCGSRE